MLIASGILDGFQVTFVVWRAARICMYRCTCAQPSIVAARKSPSFTSMSSDQVGEAFLTPSSSWHRLLLLLKASAERRVRAIGQKFGTILCNACTLRSSTQATPVILASNRSSREVPSSPRRTLPGAGATVCITSAMRSTTAMERFRKVSAACRAPWDHLRRARVRSPERGNITC